MAVIVVTSLLQCYASAASCPQADAKITVYPVSVARTM